MKNFFLVTLLISFTVLSAHAQETQEEVPPFDWGPYIGLGGSQSTSLGLIRLPHRSQSGLAYGVEVGTDGDARDQTFGRDEIVSNSVLYLTGGYQIGFRDPKQALSIFALLGYRVTEKECNRQSFIGLECFAGEEPEITRRFTAGALVFYSYDVIFAGGKITDRAQQLIFGIRFSL